MEISKAQDVRSSDLTDANPGAAGVDLKRVVEKVSNASLTDVLSANNPKVGADFLIQVKKNWVGQIDTEQEKLVSQWLKDELGIKGGYVEISAKRGILAVQGGLAICIKPIDAGHCSVSVSVGDKKTLDAWKVYDQRQVKSVLEEGARLFEKLLTNAKTAEAGEGLEELKLALGSALENTRAKLGIWQEELSLPAVPKLEEQPEAKNETPEALLARVKQQGDMKAYSFAFVMVKYGANLQEHPDLGEKFYELFKDAAAQGLDAGELITAHLGNGKEIKDERVMNLMIRAHNYFRSCWKRLL